MMTLMIFSIGIVLVSYRNASPGAEILGRTSERGDRLDANVKL